MSIEVYVRKRHSANDDARSGTIASGPARLRLGETVIDVAEGEALLIEIDELEPADDGTLLDPPSRVLAKVAAEPLSADELRARRSKEIPEDFAVTNDEAVSRAAAIDPRFDSFRSRG